MASGEGGSVMRSAIGLACVASVLLGGAACMGTVAHEERAVMRARVARRIMLSGPRTVESLSWSADSRRIAVGSVLDKRVGVYDVETGRKVPGPDDRIGGVHALAHSPDGRYLAIAHGRMEQDGQSYAVSLWDPTTGAHIQSLVESWEDVKVFNAITLAFSPDSRYLAVVYQFATFFYDVQAPGRAHAVGRTLPGLAVAFAPNSRRLAVPSVNGLVFTDVPSGHVVTTIPEYPTRLGFSPDGRFFISSALFQARVYTTGPDDAVVEAGIVPFEPSSNVMSISVSPDSRLLALGGGRIVKIFTLSDRALAATLVDHREIVMGARFSPDGRSIAAFGGPTGPTIWQFQ